MQRNENGRFVKGHKPWNTGLVGFGSENGFRKGNKVGTRNKGRTSPTKKQIDWEIDEKTGCWNCISHVPNTHGYPQCRIGYKIVVISRVVYEQHNGKIPDGMFVCHTCDNRKCINPDHLFLGTHQDNVNDMVKKGRQKGGRPKTNKE